MSSKISQEQKKSGIEKYLESPKTFHLEMPLYLKIDLKEKGNKRKLHLCLSSNEPVRSYCMKCGNDSVFRTTGGIAPSDPDDYNEWIEEGNGMSYMHYVCAVDESHRCSTWYEKYENTLVKVGQTPSVADLQEKRLKKYRCILGDEKYKEFTRGVGLFAHGVGIGSFVYLRRIFEYLIEEAYNETGNSNVEIDKENYKHSRVDEKIELLRDFLPKKLVEHKAIYKILSDGIHNLSEKQCLEIFGIIKTGIELILDDKLQKKQAEFKEKEFEKSLQEIRKNSEQ
jgi:hypothetical protein